MFTSYAIRNWANLNYRYARILIVFIAVLLFYLSHLFGILVVSLGIDPYATFLIGTCFGILAWILAPRKDTDFPIRYSSSGQQWAKIIMLCSVCIAIGGGAMCLELLPPPAQKTKSFPRQAQEQIEAVIGIPMLSKTRARKPVKRAISNWFHGAVSKRATKRMRAVSKSTTPREISTLGRIMGTIGVLMLVGLLASFVGFLSCSLSCNGNITLSYVVLIGGLGLVTLLAVKLLKYIHRKKKVDPLPDS